MADVTATFAAKDQGVAAMIQRLENKLTGFQTRMSSVSASAKRMQGSFANLGRSVVGLAAAYIGVSQAINAFNKALGTADRLDDLSTITGESAGNLAILERAFVNTGVGGDRMLPMLGKMTQFVNDLQKGTPKATAAASMLGVSFDQLQRLAPIERFKLLVRAIGNLSDENARGSGAMEVFGVRAGLVASLLANDFDGAMTKAREQLGSLPKILDENGKRLGELNDLLKNSIFTKPEEFTQGFLAGITASNDFAEALSKIDAAGFGQKIGRMFAGIAKDPGSGFVLFGEMLLLGVMKAGNALIDAAIYAGTVWQKYLADPKAQNSLLKSLTASLGTLGNWLQRTFYSITKVILQMLDKVTGGWWPETSRAIAELEKLDQQFLNQAKIISDFGAGSATSAAQRLAEIVQETPKPAASNIFDVKDQKAQVDALADRLFQLGQPESKADQFFRQINQIYQDEVEAIYTATQDRAEQLRRLETLRAQYREKALSIIKRFGEPSANLAPPQAQMQQNAMPQATREEMARQASASALPASAQEEVASEPTLKRAVDLLAELNTKLPQPVLV